MGFVQKEWLIYFYENPKEERSPWLHFVKKGFRHCGALGYIPPIKRWVHLEWTHMGVRHILLDDDEMNQIISYMYDFKMLKCPVKDLYQLLRIKDYTCVSFVMRLIGYYKWWIFTPYQLYCALKKDGYQAFYQNIRRNNVKEEQIDTRNN